MPEAAEDLVALLVRVADFFEVAGDVADAVRILSAEEVDHGRVEAVRIKGLELARQEEGVEGKVEPDAGGAGDGCVREELGDAPAKGKLVVAQSKMSRLAVHVQQDRRRSRALGCAAVELFAATVKRVITLKAAGDNDAWAYEVAPNLPADLGREPSELGKCGWCG